MLTAAGIALGACGPENLATAPAPVGSVESAPTDWLTGARVLVSGHDVDNKDCRAAICRHNENTDLVTFRGAIYLVHRTAWSQVLGPNSSLHVYRSVDGGRSFERTARIEAPFDPATGKGRDLRDPHFFVVGDELRIKALTRLPVNSTRDSNVDTVAVLTRSTDASAWTPLEPIAPPTWSLWRVKERGGAYFSAAYEDGDKSVVLFRSADGLAWQMGAPIYTRSEDTPSETELVFMPSGKLLALVRMDGTEEELLGDRGRLRTKVCWADPPYEAFSCPDELTGQRLDGPLAWTWNGRLFVVARKHLPQGGKKRTALFEVTGDLEGGKLGVREWGELPSAGDTSYAGVAFLDASRALVSWYSGDLEKDETWALGMFGITDIWVGTLDARALR